METVTFIMPVYNAAEFLTASIESVINQTYSDWQLIIVDDCSTDNSLAIARRYAAVDGRIRVIEMDAPSGSAYLPRKTGIMAAPSGLVSPLDADDYVEPDYLRKLLDKRKETGANIVYPAMWRPVGDGKSLLLTPTEPSLYGNVFDGKECVKYTLDGWRINCNGGIIEKELYLTAFQKFEPTHIHTRSDEMLTRYLLSVTPKVAFSDAKYFYRLNEASVTQSVSISYFDYLYNDIELIDFTASCFARTSEEYLLSNRQAFHGVFDSLRILNKTKFSESERDSIYELLSKSKGKVDLNSIGRHISPRYKTLFKFDLKTTQFFLSFLDKIFPQRS